ncbi:MAG: protein kinase [Verrucomicrobia bacterium]|nr:protein kinase [Verrucomicrobiota bacterium]MBS0637713.1 protein kinase [Verrucomicrobiota bacterium]
MGLESPISQNHEGLAFSQVPSSGNAKGPDAKQLMDQLRQTASCLNEQSSPEELLDVARDCANLIIANQDDANVRIFGAEIHDSIQTFGNQEASSTLKVALKFVEALPPEDLKSDFDTTVSHLKDKYKLDEKTVQQEAHLLNCSPEMALLSMMKRLTYRLTAGFSPETSPTHSPSIAKRSEQTGLDPSIVRSVEKLFSATIKGKHSFDAELQTGGHTFYISHSGVTIQTDQVSDKGGFKTCRLATSYFAQESPQEQPQLVTLRPTREQPSKSSFGSFDDSFDRFQPDQATARDRSASLQSASLQEEIASQNEIQSMVVLGDESNNDHDSTISSEADEPTSMVVDSQVGDAQSQILVDVNRQINLEQLAPAAPRKIDDTIERQEYEREIDLTKKFQGEGVVKMHSVVALESGDRVMVQEAAGFQLGGHKVINFADAAELFDAGNGPLTDEEKLQLCQMIDGALLGSERIAQLGYIHRDLKELNILVTNKGNGVVCDFGLAVEESDSSLKRHSGGTPGYMSPEVILFSNQNESDKITKQSDIWSWGMILQNVFKEGGIVSHPIYGGTDSRLALIGKLAALRDPENIASYESSYQEPEDRNSLDHLIWSATRLDPEQRPTISEFRARFQEISASREFKSSYLKIV